MNQLEEEVQQTSKETRQKTAPKCVPRFLNATPSALTRLQIPGPSVSPTLGEFYNQSTLKEFWNQVKHRLGVQKVPGHKSFFSWSSLFSNDFFPDSSTCASITFFSFSINDSGISPLDTKLGSDAAICIAISLANN